MKTTPETDTLYRENDVNEGNRFSFFGGSFGGYQMTVHATAADGRLVSITAFVDALDPAGCRTSAQAVIG